METTQNDDDREFLKAFITCHKTNQKFFTKDAFKKFPFLDNIIMAANESAISADTTNLINVLASSLAVLTIKSKDQNLGLPWATKLERMEHSPTMEPFPCVKDLPDKFRYQIVDAIKNIYGI